MLPATPPTEKRFANAPYLDATLPLEERVNNLISLLTLEQKAEIIHGASSYTYGKMPAIGLSEFATLDGPQGMRLSEGKASTALPCALAMAATWNDALITQGGKVLGQECRAANGRIVLGPGVNMMRTPLGGRNFEYFGEDPLLAGKIAAAYIRGVQSEGSAACLKHWLLNDQEWARTVINVEVNERALREIYVRPFEIAIKESNPWSIMSSYNLVRDRYTSHNRPLNNILFKEFNWDGSIISDWGAWHGDIPAINGGCTLEMPSSKNPEKDKAIAQAVLDGKIDKIAFEDAVKRNVRLLFRIGAFDNTGGGKNNTPQQADIARTIAEESIVLLKNNDDILPLNPQKIKKIAVIGPNADQYHTMLDNSDLKMRGGAGATRGTHEITPLQAIVKQYGEKNVLFAPGFRFEEAGLRSFPNMKEYSPVQAAKEADVVLFFAGTDHSYDKEKHGWGIQAGADKPDLNLKGEQAALIKEIVAINPKTLIILTLGAPVQMEEWIDTVPALLISWYGGQEAGDAVNNVLIGKANPSGKLPCTFGKKLTDWKSHQLGERSYPGVISKNAEGKETRPEQIYEDDIWVGYRHFDQENITPRYPFGYGLSYTTFQLTKLTNEEIPYAVTIKNTGKRAGAEVIQCYISKPSPKGVQMPRKELIGYKKICLNPNEETTVNFDIPDSAKQYWNECTKSWKIASGEYTILIGTSSRSLPITYTFKEK